MTGRIVVSLSNGGGEDLGELGVNGPRSSSEACTFGDRGEDLFASFSTSIEFISSSGTIELLTGILEIAPCLAGVNEAERSVKQNHTDAKPRPCWTSMSCW